MPAPLASAVLERAVELPAPPSFDGDRKKDLPSSVATSSKGKGKSSSGEAKVPKWLKLGPSAFRSIVPFYSMFVTFYCREVNFSTRMVPVCYSQLTREKLLCSCSCCMCTSDTRHIVDTSCQRLLPKYTYSLLPVERLRSIDGKVRVNIAGPCAKSANEILDNKRRVAVNAS